MPLPPSSVSHILWPGITGGRAASVAALLCQLEASQWLPAEQLETLQLRQFASLAEYAATHSSYYRQAFAGIRVDKPAKWSMQRLREIPLLSSQAYSAAADTINLEPPADHGGYIRVETSGSTGRPTRLLRTGLCSLIWEALTLREHLWHRRKFAETLGISRAKISAPDAQPRRHTNWGPPTSQLFATGNLEVIDVRKPVDAQAEWLSEFNPAYFLTYPTNLAALIEIFAERRQSARPLSRLLQVRTVAENVGEELRQRCRAVLGVDIADTYSSQEFGPIAFQCRESATYHIQAENLIVEVLAEDGRPCAAGEVGQLVVTDLHNFASPLIRYAIGDYAEVAAPCPCGRGLPALKRIVGRSRNMAVLPDGRRYWPSLCPYSFRELAGVSQIQVIQTTPTHMQVIYVAPQPATADQQAAMTAKLTESMSHAFDFEFLHQTTPIQRSPGGKFEDFICQVSPGKREAR